MKISLSWLSDYLSAPIDAAEAAEALTHGGQPVESVEQVGDDTVIDVEVTSNRGDCLSHIGVAREIAALTGREFEDLVEWKMEDGRWRIGVGSSPVHLPSSILHPPSSTSAASLTSVRIDALDLCPHYTARILRNIKVGPSPAWMMRRLEAAGVRAINNIVDVTNYVMLEMGQPLHAFDFEHLAGRQIIVRKARAFEKIVSIDGHERQFKAGMLIIADAKNPVALAGVMGGRDTEVGEATTSVLLESARFDPLSVRRTARALTMMSESSYRFERQIDPLLPERASLRAAQLILETAGGELLAGVVSAGSPGHTPKTLTLRLAKLKAVLGIELPVDQVMAALTSLRLAPVPHDGRIDVTVPSYRLDLNLEIDLVEEVARVVGYAKIPQRDEISIRLVPPDPAVKTLDNIRSLLVAGGYFEAITVSFVSDALAGDFVPPEAASLPQTSNVRWGADNHLRPSLLPGLLESVRRNETAGTLGAHLFEIGSTFWHDAGGKLVERRRLAFAGGTDLREVRGMVESLLWRLDADRSASIIPDSRPGFSADACGRIQWGQTAIGHVGLIDHKTAEKLALRQIPAAAELDLDPLIQGAVLVPQVHPLARFPAVRRDVSLVVAETVRYAQVEELIRSLSLAELEDVEYVTTYRGKPLEKGTKSLTTTLVFRSATATLLSSDVDSSVQRFIDAAKEKLGATLRT